MKNNLKNIEKILKALANTRRLEIVRFLNKEKEAPVGQIAEAVGISFRATSRHLGVLRNAGILDKEQKSLEVWYKLEAHPHSIVSHTLNIV